MADLTLKQAFAKNKQKADNRYAKPDGFYERMGVGRALLAENLVAQLGHIDTNAYQFRTSGGGADISGTKKVHKIVANSVILNQLLMPYDSNLNADYYFCECENMITSNCSYIKQTGDNYKTDFIDNNCDYGSFHAEAYLGYTAPYEASGKGFVHNFDESRNASMMYLFDAPGGGKADLVLRGATNIVNTGNYSATALNVGTAVNIELNGVSINHLIKSTDNFVGKAAGPADPQNRNTTHAGTGFSLNGRYLSLLWTDVVIKGVNLSIGKNTLKISAKNGSKSGHWDSIKFDITPYKNGGSSEGEANKETINGITFTNNGDGSFSVSGTATADAIKIFLSRDWDINHSYLVRGLLNKGIDGSVYWYDNSNGQQFSSSKDFVFKPTSTSNSQRKVALMIKSGTTVNFTFFPQVYDQTPMFGAGKEPTTLEQFYATDLGKSVIAIGHLGYTEGRIATTDITKMVNVGYNLCNGIFRINPGVVDRTCIESELIPAISGKTYVFEEPSFENYQYRYFQVLDENRDFVRQEFKAKTTTGPIEITLNDNEHYLRVQYWNNAANPYADVPSPEILRTCVHLAGSRTGYERYEKHEYPAVFKGYGFGGAKDEYYPDGHIVRKMGFVDLGTLNFVKAHSGQFYASTSSITPAIKVPASYDKAANIFCSLYTTVKAYEAVNGVINLAIGLWTNGDLYIKDSSCSTPAELLAKVSGKYLYYELVTSTTETGQPYDEEQIVDDYGTEEFVFKSGELPVPVGHETFYQVNLQKFVQRMHQALEGDAGNVAKASDLEALDNRVEALEGSRLYKHAIQAVDGEETFTITLLSPISTALNTVALLEQAYVDGKIVNCYGKLQTASTVESILNVMMVSNLFGFALVDEQAQSVRCKALGGTITDTVELI